MCMYVSAINSTVFIGERMNPVFCRERWASEEAQAFVSKTEDLAYAYWPPVASPLLLYNIVTSDFVQCLLSPQVDSQNFSILREDGPDCASPSSGSTAKDAKDCTKLKL